MLALLQWHLLLLQTNGVRLLLQMGGPGQTLPLALLTFDTVFAGAQPHQCNQ